MKILTCIAIAAVALAAPGCGSDDSAPSSSLPKGDETVELDPADFTAEITNQYWPMRIGSKWVYREVDPEGGSLRVEVTVTPRMKKIAGIEARIVHDVVTEDGEVKEDTFDWYAQDKDGNLWYLGEATKEFANGKVVSTEGSWEHGVDGAQAGILLPAQPEAGLVYRQEYYEGKAEDAAEVLSLDERAKVPFGTFVDCLKTKDYTPLEPDVLEHKYYAKGMGPVLAVAVSGGGGREELIAFRN
jgi:hypothetical protein